MSHPERRYPGPRGFSLLELLVVVAVIAVLMAMVAPAIAGMSGSAGRKGAVTLVMSAAEQARVAALESGRATYLVLWRRQFPEQDAIKVIRETEDGTGEYEQLTKWLKLPKGVILHQPDRGKSLLHTEAGTPADLDTARLPQQVAPGQGEMLNYLEFSPAGSVAHPAAGRQFLKLILSEGVRGQGGTEALISRKKQDAGGYEILSFAQFTGRVQLDFSTIPTP